MSHKQFVGKLAYLSNMSPVRIYLRIGEEVYEFSCSESAFQAMKFTNPTILRAMESLNGYQAKSMATQLKKYIRADWNQIKLAVMERLIEAKFSNEVLRAKLIAEPLKNIIEHNTWGDTFWGVCNGVGQDHLGKLLRKHKLELIGEIT